MEFVLVHGFSGKTELITMFYGVFINSWLEIGCQNELKTLI